MSKVSRSVSIDLSESLTQKDLTNIEAFKSGLKLNERIKIDFGQGNTIVFSRYKESVTEQGLRIIGNFINKFKTIRALSNNQMNSDAIGSEITSFGRKALGAQNQMPELKNIHSHVSKKFHAGEKLTISAKNFQSLTGPLAQKLSAPIFEELKDSNVNEPLTALQAQMRNVSIDSRQVDFMAGTGEDRQKVVDEFKAFFAFVENQVNQDTGLYTDRKAADFAKRWMDFALTDKAGLMKEFGGQENFNAISRAAAALLAFVQSGSA